MDLIRSSSAKTRSNESLNEANNQNRYIANEELSAAAMKASIISPYFWILSPSAQNATLKLETLIDKYNRVFRRLNELEDHILLNKMERQTTDKMLKVYEETSEKYARDINSISQQLTELIRTQASKGMKPIIRSGQNGLIQPT